MDHAEIDPEVGTWADVDAIAAERRVMADAVVNHVSARGRWFTEWQHGVPERDGFFRVVPTGTDLSTVVRPRPGPPLAPARRGGEPVDVWATFSADQIDLDFRTPAVLLEIVDALIRYVDHGAAAVRLDAIGYVWKEPGRPSLHEPETHMLVAVLRSVLDDLDPSIVLVTETNVPHHDNVAYFGSADAPEADAVYQFTLAPLVLHAVQTGAVEPLRRWARSLEARPGRTFMNFLASHDGVGVRPAAGWLTGAEIEALADRCRRVGGVVNEAATADGSEPYELAATWRSLCGVDVDDATARARLVAGHAVMFAMAGIPLLYVHSLTASPNAEARAAASGLGRDLNRGRFADPAAFRAALEAGGVWASLAEMLTWRAASAAFHPESPQHIHDGPAGTIAVERGEGADAALVVTELAGSAATVAIGGGWSRWDGAVAPAALDLAPHEAVWLRRTR